MTLSLLLGCTQLSVMSVENIKYFIFIVYLIFRTIFQYKINLRICNIKFSMLSRAFGDEIHHMISGSSLIKTLQHGGPHRRILNSSKQCLSHCKTSSGPAYYKYIHQDVTTKSIRNEIAVEEDSIPAPVWDVSFENVQDAYMSKSNAELFRSLMVFKMCGINLIVDNSMLVSYISACCYYLYVF